MHASYLLARVQIRREVRAAALEHSGGDQGCQLGEGSELGHDCSYSGAWRHARASSLLQDETSPYHVVGRSGQAAARGAAGSGRASGCLQ